MTLMTNDLNDHHDRMVVVEVFVYDKKMQSLTLSRVPGFYNLTIKTTSLQSSHEFREAYYLN